jgi:hypothetical protein
MVSVLAPRLTMPVLAPERLVIEPLLLHRQDMSKMPLLMTAFEAAMLHCRSCQARRRH